MLFKANRAVGFILYGYERNISHKYFDIHYIGLVFIYGPLWIKPAYFDYFQSLCLFELIN